MEADFVNAFIQCCTIDPTQNALKELLCSLKSNSIAPISGLLNDVVSILVAKGSTKEWKIMRSLRSEKMSLLALDVTGFT